MKNKTVPIPPPSDAWRDSFRKSTVKIGWGINLSRMQLKMLCAIADNVHWDRDIARQSGGGSIGNNPIGAKEVLSRKGLIERRSEDEIKRDSREWGQDIWNHPGYQCYQLSPAGKLLVDLLKVAGLFVEQENAIIKKAKGRRQA